MNLNFLKVGKKGPARTAAGGAGFTLIELLVVIAIIGILSGIVLTSLGTARTKAKNASAMASMSSMRAEAELNVNSSGNYPDALCVTTAATLNQTLGVPLDKLATAVTNNAAVPVCTFVIGGTAPYTITKWAASVTLPGGGGTFCVDSSGTSKASQTALVTGLCG